MSSTDGQVPDDVPEGDYVDQHTLADGTPDDGTDATPAPDLDLDTEADPADLQEQQTPAPVDDDER